jgi:hypothetical protein
LSGAGGASQAVGRGEATPVSAARTRCDWLVMAGLSLTIVVAVWVPQLRGLYPFTYDELAYLRKTRAYDQWLREGLRHLRAGEPAWLLSRQATDQAEALKDMHPGFAKLVGLLPSWAVQAALHREGGARFTGCLFLALACCAMYWFLVPRCGRLWALTGALGLATNPRVFGHAHFHAMDVPIMAMSLVAALACHRAAHSNRWRPAASAGVWVGLSFATKLNALALVPQVGLWLLWQRPAGWRRLLICLPLALPVFLLCWPWLWHDTFARLGEYVSFHAAHYSPGVTYFGRVYGGQTTAPWHYPLAMLAFTLPVTWGLALLTGAVQAGRGRLGKAGGFLLLGLGCNLALSCWPAAARYGGIRLFLPALPFVYMLGALVISQWLARVRISQWPRGWLLQALIVTGLLLPGLAGIGRTYPYCLSYYGGLCGGLPGAARLGMELTYWGDAYGGAREFMSRPENARARFVAAQELATGPLDALVKAGEIPPQHRLLGRFVHAELPPDADYIIVDAHPPMWPPAVAELVRGHTPVFVVSREQVALLSIYRNPARQPRVRAPGAVP